MCKLKQLIAGVRAGKNSVDELFLTLVNELNKTESKLQMLQARLIDAEEMYEYLKQGKLTKGTNLCKMYQKLVTNTKVKINRVQSKVNWLLWVSERRSI